MRRNIIGATLALSVVVGVTTGTPRSAHAHSGDYLLVWAGDWNGSDATTSGASDPQALAAMAASGGAPGPDFLAVIDADPASPSYGRVVNTVTVPGVENEPHHMQYVWKPGERVYAGGLFSDATFVFDVDDLPNVRLAGTVGALDTPCGSVPDAYWVLSDGSAVGTYMGGPNAAGDPRCNGGDSNGFAGTPGELVRISADGRVLGEFPAAGDPANPPAADVRPNRCSSNPPLRTPSCANPHGIQAREDLGVVITSDYAEPRNVPVHPANTPDNRVFRDTVRVWNLSGDLSGLSLRSVSVMPRTGLSALPPEQADPRGFMGIMETTITNLPGHRGAFASSMCGGAIYYTADVTAAEPYWTQVADLSSVVRAADPSAGRVDGCAGAGWLQTSPDDTVLFQAVIGRSPGTLAPEDPGVPKMVYALDVRGLVDVAPSAWKPGNPAVCSVDTADEVLNGGAEASCPTIVGRQVFADTTSGGPHWGTIDAAGAGGAGRLTSVRRIATSSYFVARSGTDGDHTVCMVHVGADGAMALDTTFRDEVTRAPCVDFDRAGWPHGAFGPAKPHAVLFARAT